MVGDGRQHLLSVGKDCHVAACGVHVKNIWQSRTVTGTIMNFQEHRPRAVAPRSQSLLNRTAGIYLLIADVE